MVASMGSSQSGTGSKQLGRLGGGSAGGGVYLPLPFTSAAPAGWRHWLGYTTFWVPAISPEKAVRRMWLSGSKMRFTSCTATGASHSGQQRSTEAYRVRSRPRHGKLQPATGGKGVGIEGLWPATMAMLLVEQMRMLQGHAEQSAAVSSSSETSSHPSKHCHSLGQALQSLSAMRRPLAAQKGSARWHEEQARLVSGPAAPQKRQSHRGSSAAAASAVLQGSGGAWTGAQRCWPRCAPCPCMHKPASMPGSGRLHRTSSHCTPPTHQAGCLAIASIFLAYAGDTWAAYCGCCRTAAQRCIGSGGDRGSAIGWQ